MMGRVDLGALRSATRCRTGPTSSSPAGRTGPAEGVLVAGSVDAAIDRAAGASTGTSVIGGGTQIYARRCRHATHQVAHRGAPVARGRHPLPVVRPGRVAPRPGARTDDGFSCGLAGARRRPDGPHVPIAWCHDVRHRFLRAPFGRVLTAMVTPFHDDGVARPRRPPRGSPSTSSTTATTGWWSAARRGVADDQRRREGRLDPRRRRGGRRPGARRRRASAPTTPPTPSSSPRRPRRPARTACCW